MALSATDMQYLENRALEELGNFMGNNEIIRSYIESFVESMFPELDTESAMTENEMELYTIAVQKAEIKLLALMIAAY